MASGEATDLTAEAFPQASAPNSAELNGAVRSDSVACRRFAFSIRTRGIVMRIAYAFILGAALTGCATKIYTPSEYREEVRNYKGMLSSLVAYEPVDVPRPYQQLSDTVRRKSKECLDATVESSSMVKQGMYWVRETSRVTYKPIFTVAKGKTELTVQGESS